MGLISESSTDYAPGKFSVFTVTRSKIKMQTIQYRKSRIWEMKEYKYTKSHAKNGFLFLRYFIREIFGKTFYPNLKALNGDAMCRVGVNLPRRRSSQEHMTNVCVGRYVGVPLSEGHKLKYGRRKPTETSVFEFSYLCVRSSVEELINVKVI